MPSAGHNLYRSIIKPIRDADQSDGMELLKRFLTGPQATHDRVEQEVLSILAQIKPDEVRPDLLLYLLGIVGFTSELRGITDRLDETALRRLVTLAVPLWKQRHTPAGLINAIRLLTGRNAFYTSWFGFRWLLGETMLIEDQLASGGDPWVIGSATMYYDEYWSNIRIMDDGTLDELLLLDVVRLERPMSERFEVFLNDFLDKFDGELDKWDIITPSQAAIVDGVFEIQDDNVHAKPIIPLLPTPADNLNYNIVTKFRTSDESIIMVTRFYEQIADDTYYELYINPTDAANGTVSLYATVGGGTSIIIAAFTPAMVPLKPGIWYKLRITIETLSTTQNLIRVLIDGNEVINFTHTHAIGFLIYGGYKFISGGGPMSLDNVESWRNPSRWATVQLSTPSEPGGAVVMSPNFVQ